jgi:hypothetical protein
LSSKINSRIRKTQKKQKSIRQDQINRNRYLEKNAKIAYILSHGDLLENPEIIKIPSNIRLLQITDPRKIIDIIDAYSLIKQMVTVRENKLFLNRDIEGKDIKSPPIYKSNTEPYYYFPVNTGNKFIITEPNNETSNLSLDFKESPEKYHIFLKDLNIKLPNNQTISTEEIVTLKDVLELISDEHDKNCKAYNLDSNKYPLDVIQISCKFGKHYADIENLTRDFEKTLKIENTPESYYCGITEDLTKIYLNNFGNTEGFFDWLNENYTPIYDKNYKEFAKEVCTNDQME